MGINKAGRLVLVFALGSLLSCNGGTGESPPDARADGSSVPDGGTATVLIGPAGGTFSFFGGKVKLEVPPGALAKETSIGVKVPNSYPQDARLVPGTVYDLLPDGTTFTKAVKLSISYDQDGVPKGTAETGLRIHKVVSGIWALISGGGADGAANVAWTRIDSFSKYGIMGPTPTAVDGMIDAGVDAAVPVDAPKPDGTKPDASGDLKSQCSGQPQGVSCNDGYPCTKGDVCDGKGACAGVPYVCNPGSCSGVCDGKGGCTSAFKPKGTACDDKLACTLGDVCDGQGSCKSATLKSDHCLISGTCYKDGTKHPTKSCYQCDIKKSQTVWSPDINNCLIDGKCYSKGAKHPSGCAQCDPASSKTAWTVSGSGCLIGAACRAKGAKEPGGCGICDPSKSKTAWSRPAGCLVTHVWSRGFGGLESDTAHAIALDGKGNVYITGSFGKSINFGSSTFVTAGGKDIFLASFTPGGKHRWSMSIGNSGHDTGYDVAVDSNDNLYVTGTFATTVKFGNSKLQSKGTYDVFVASFDSSGKHRWSRNFFRSIKDNGVPSIAVDGSGNTYITGRFAGSTNFGGPTLNSKSSKWDVYLASFNSSGKHRWSKSFGSTTADMSQGVAVDGSGNVYVAGDFESSINFGGPSLSSKGGFSDVFLTSFTTNGIHRWSKSFGGTSTDSVLAVAVDSNANVLITGYFLNSAEFGGGKLTSNGSSDLFVAKFAPSGKHHWSKALGGSGGYEKGQGITADSSGNVYVTGYFANPVDFGGGTLTSNGSMDMFIVSLTPTGKHRWSRSHGSIWYDQGLAIKTVGSGSTYVAGSFDKTVDFGGGLITSAGKSDTVLLKLSP